MKKIFFIISILSLVVSSIYASPKHEFRATWFTTVANIDWPKTKVTDDASREQQKKELTDRLDELAANNINAVFFQVRGRSDAFYNSNYEPWAVELTGELGKDPDYDPLAFVIEEAHKRGMELHAWINPFRIATAESNQMTENKVNTLYKAPDSKEKLKWDWVLSYYTKTKKQDRDSLVNQIVDPGNPGAREYVVNVMMDIVTNYDIDGVVMDDYFYAYAGTSNQDQASQDAYYTPNEDKITDQDGDGDTLDDWRRSNVDKVIAEFSSQVRVAKPWVRFGMGPGGIWTVKNKAAEAYGIRLPNNITGADLYDLLGCNTVEWIKNGWVDYVCPQIYWATTAAKQDYDVLCAWWAKDVCEHFSNLLPGEQRVQFYPSQAGYKVYEYKNKNTQERYEGFGQDAAEGIQEIINQIESNRQHLSSGYTGSVYFSNKDFVEMSSEIKAACYQQKALVPPMAWKSTETLDAPNTLRINGDTMTWAHASADRFTVYIYPKNVHVSRALEEPYYFQGVVYGKSFTLPNTFNTTTHNVAVCAYDRYGVEHAPAEYGPDVTYVLNGGVVEYEAQITVPTNEELWEQFKPYYNEYYTLNRSLTFTVNQVTLFAATLMKDIMTNNNSKYKWLGDYIAAVSQNQGITIGSGDYNTENTWRFMAHAFFGKSSAGTYWDGVANKTLAHPNFSEAGKPEKWGPAYLAAHTPMNIPTQPTNEELMVQFMNGYLDYFKNKIDKSSCSNITTLYNNKNISGFLSHGSASSSNHEHSILVANMMTDANSGWKWLGDYIAKVSGTFSLNTDARWRHSIAAFFMKEVGNSSYTVSFKEAGEESAWEEAWRAVNPATPADPVISEYTLPAFIETDLTLPTEESRPVYITHPNKYVFAGWVDNAGNSIPSLSAGYKGTVYAQWNSPIKWVLNGGTYTGHHELPLAVDEEYTLPTVRNMRKEGNKFKGWYDNADFTGDALTTIPANYTGTLYAEWEEGTPITWHPGADLNITNEDLWELFVIDYNDFYTSDILGENRSTENRAYQAITGAFGFMHSGEDNFKTGGRAKDFMEHEQSPWKWLGDYIIETLDEENKKLQSNAPLWTSFKEATGLTHLGALKDMDFVKICGTGALDDEGEESKKDGKTGRTILNDLFARPEWEWLRDYIITKHTEQKNNSKVCDDGISRTPVQLTSDIDAAPQQWRYAVAAFFLQSQHKVQWPLTADFSTAGKHSEWKDVIPEEYHELGHFRITSDLEWRKTLHAFFNHTNTLTYTVNSTTKTEGTADFTIKGLPRPITNPEAGWYNDWWNGNFPAYLNHNDPLPYIKRDNYIFAGWHYGNENGFVLNDTHRAGDNYNADMQAEYRNHLWARWLELCLYEGYVDPDPYAMDGQGNRIEGKVNNNYDMVKYASAETAMSGQPHQMDVERTLVGGMYNTMFLPFGINGVGGKINGEPIPGKQYYLPQVVDDNGKQLLPPATTSILVYDGCEIVKEGGEELLVFNFHEYAEQDLSETLYARNPFLIKPAEDVTVRMHFWKVNMQFPFNENQQPSFEGNAKFQGVYKPTILANEENMNHLILTANERLAQVASESEMLGLRAYFRVPKDVPQGIRSVIRVSDEMTDVENVPTDLPMVRKIMQNGKIFILRDGKLYDLMGRCLK